jgi:hypothetical protein
MKDRFILLLKKLLGRKGVVFIIATVLMFMENMTVDMWSFFAATFIGVATVEKIIELFKVKGE